jgi:hypothetical protein
MIKPREPDNTFGVQALPLSFPPWGTKHGAVPTAIVTHAASGIGIAISLECCGIILVAVILSLVTGQAWVSWSESICPVTCIGLNPGSSVEAHSGFWFCRLEFLSKYVYILFSRTLPQMYSHQILDISRGLLDHLSQSVWANIETCSHCCCH